MNNYCCVEESWSPKDTKIIHKIIHILYYHLLLKCIEQLSHWRVQIRKKTIVNRGTPWESWHFTQTHTHTQNPSSAKTVSPCWKLLTALGIRNPTIKHMGIKIIVSCVVACKCICVWCVSDRWMEFSKTNRHAHFCICSVFLNTREEND